MGITAERLSRSRVLMEIEVAPERLEASMEKVVRKLSQQVRIPGFRPGKAPREIVERTVGQPLLLHEAIEDLLPGLYREALEAESIEAIDHPEIEMASTDPLVVRATVPVRPTIDIGNYRALRAPRPEPEAGEERVAEALTSLRRRYATLEPVDRPVQWGDTVRVDVSVSVEGQSEPHAEEGAEFAVTEGGIVSLPGFLDRLIGLERGGTHEFSFALPDDYQAEELAGKTASYRVRIHEIKQDVLPGLDDDFARSLDEEGIGSLAELDARVREGVRARAEAEAEHGYRDEVVDLLLANAELDYPEVLVEREIDRLVDEQSQHAAHNREDLERWFEAIGRTEEEVRGELHEPADLLVRRSLVLGEFAEREGIEAKDEEVAAQVDALVAQTTGDSADLEQRARMRGAIDTPDGRASIRSRLITERAVARLVEIASQEDEAPEARAPRRRRRARAADGEGGAAAAQADGPEGEGGPEGADGGAAEDPGEDGGGREDAAGAQTA